MENDNWLREVPKILKYSFSISVYFSAYFVSPQKYLAVLFFPYWLLFAITYYWWNSKEIDGKDFLTLETLNLNFWSFLFLLWE
jgi:hypothetical protein